MYQNLQNQHAASIILMNKHTAFLSVNSQWQHTGTAEQPSRWRKKVTPVIWRFCLLATQRSESYEALQQAAWTSQQTSISELCASHAANLCFKMTKTLKIWDIYQNLFRLVDPPSTMKVYKKWRVNNLRMSHTNYCKTFTFGDWPNLE